MIVFDFLLRFVLRLWLLYGHRDFLDTFAVAPRAGPTAAVVTAATGEGRWRRSTIWYGTLPSAWVGWRVLVEFPDC